MGCCKSKPELPQDLRLFESFGVKTLPASLPEEPGESWSNRRLVEWWSALQLVPPEVSYAVVDREPRPKDEIACRDVSHFATSTRFETLSPLTRLLVELTISDMKRSTDRLERLCWQTGCNISVWVQPGARSIRIEYVPKNRKFMAIYTYVHLSKDLRFERYEYYANLW